MKHFLTIVFLFSLLSFPFYAQDVTLSQNRGIYTFLINLSVKGYIVVNDETLPWSRQYIAEKLVEAAAVRSSLTGIEKKDLDFYSGEYVSEIERSRNESVIPELKYLSFEKPESFRFFHYSDSLLNFYADPILGFGINHDYGENQLSIYNGVNVYGSLNSSFRFKTFYTDHKDNGEHLDVDRRFTDKTGFVYIKHLNRSIEYDYVNAELTYGWKWGEFGQNRKYIFEI
jgi:hypothetical protein